MQQGNFVLIGYMGSGKTTVGGVLASMAGMDFVDMDPLMEERAGMSISRIFELETEKGFRDRESALIRDLAGENRRGVVYATGGGSPLREENRKLLRSLGTVIWLQVSAESVLERLKDATDRPLLQRPDREQAVSDMIRERGPAYEACADISVCTDKKLPEAIAREILTKAGESEFGLPPCPEAPDRAGAKNQG
ncbi:MAG: shikimate kinase [Lachnospiraceae bacterium]|nr:shikimate kinase [Lachnospiraceae bacterium]